MKNLNDTGTKSWFGSEDTTCNIYCECEYWLDDPDASPLFVSSTDIVRCSHCVKLSLSYGNMNQAKG